MKKRISLFLIFSILLIFLIVPLFKSYIPGTTDGLAHKFRLVAFERVLLEGNIRPRWLGDIALGYGSPVFIYNYLLPYYVVSGIHHLGFSINESTQIFEALTLIFSAIGMYLLANLLWGQIAGISASVLYVWSPHHLITIFLAEGWGEMISFVFPPWIFFVALLLIRQFEFKNNSESTYSRLAYYFIALVILWVLFILSYNIMALLFSIIYIVGFLISGKRNIKSALVGISAWTSACIVSAFFWLPAVSLMRFINYPALITQEIQQLFLHMYSLSYQFQTAVRTVRTQVTYPLDFTLGIPILLLSFVGSALVIVNLLKKKKENTEKNIYIALIIVAFFWICFFLADPISINVWLRIPFLKFVVYPVRFLIPATFIGSLLGGFFLHNRKYLAVVFISLAVLSGRPYTIPYVDIFPFPDNYFYQSQPIYHPPTTMKNMAVTEFLPIWAKEYFLGKIEESYYSSGKLADRFVLPEGAGQIKLKKNNSEDIQAEIILLHSSLVTLNTFYYPNWQTYLDGIQIQTDRDSQGRIVVPVREGKHTLRFLFGKSGIEIFADTLSIAGIILCVIAFVSIQKWKWIRRYI